MTAENKTVSRELGNLEVCRVDAQRKVWADERYPKAVTARTRLPLRLCWIYLGLVLDDYQLVKP